MLVIHSFEISKQSHILLHREMYACCLALLTAVEMTTYNQCGSPTNICTHFRQTMGQFADLYIAQNIHDVGFLLFFFATNVQVFDRPNGRLASLIYCVCLRR